MKTDMFIVQPLENIENSKSFFDNFSKKYTYLTDIFLKFTPDTTYENYNEDFNNLSRSWTAEAEIIDTRNLIGYENIPVRLILSKDFFIAELSKQEEIILHELGHFLTNSNLNEIRNLIAEKNPKILGVNNPSLNNLVNAHNEGLSYIFQILKLIQEVNAEMWVFENEKNYSQSRLQLYCNEIDNFLASTQNGINVSRDFFYQIPKLNFLLLWRESIVKHTDFSFSKNCLTKVNLAFNNLEKLAINSGWSNLKLLNKKDEILTAIEYKNENIETLKNIYIQLFEEYIYSSSQFFPSELITPIRNFYNIQGYKV